MNDYDKLPQRYQLIIKEIVFEFKLVSIDVLSNKIYYLFSNKNNFFWYNEKWGSFVMVSDENKKGTQTKDELASLTDKASPLFSLV